MLIKMEIGSSGTVTWHYRTFANI